MQFSSFVHQSNLANANIFSKFYLANCNLQFANVRQTVRSTVFDPKGLVMSASDIRRHNIRRLIDAAVANGSSKNDSDWCKQRDIDPSYLSQLMNGHRPIGEKSARTLEKKIGLANTELDIDVDSVMDKIHSKMMIPVHAWDSDTPLDDDEVAIPFFKDFLVSCGTGTIGEALRSERRRLRLSKVTLRASGVDPSNAVAMTAYGNSMFPEIKDKATVYVDIGDKKATDGCIYAIMHGGAFKFKYLYNLPKGGLRVVSKNAEEYPEERLTADELIEQEFEIIGYAFDVQNPLPRR